MSLGKFDLYESGIGAEEFMAKLQDGSPPEEVIRSARLYRGENLPAININTNINAARKFARYVQKHPKACSKLAPQIINLRPYFIRAYFNGIRHAVKEKSNIDWEPVLLLSRQILEPGNLNELERETILYHITPAIKAGIEAGFIDYTTNHVRWILCFDD